MKLNDLTGKQFGRLTVVSRAENSNAGQARWVCKCQCGNVVTVRGTHLTEHKILSCGCFASDVNTSHGCSRTPEYRAYYNMLKRCEYENDSAFPNYGGRGIKVCDRWKRSFENFYADMGARPSKRYSLDRINPNGNYEPTNCRWADLKTQAHNQRPRRDTPVGFRGVVRGKHGNFVAQIYTDGKTCRIGTFPTVQMAAFARYSAEVSLWGGDAR